MRYLVTMTLTFALVLSIAPEVWAQTVTWTSPYPKSPQAGQIAGQGTATAGTNQTLTGVTLYATSATDTAGGPGGEKVCSVTGGKTFTGTITGLPTGTYKVYARMQYTISGQTKYWDGPMATGLDVK